MNKIILPLLLGLGISLNVQAQDNLEKVANYSADYLCNCLNKVYADIDTDVKDVFIKGFAMTEAERDKYFDGLPEELQARIADQIDLLESDNIADKFDDCGMQMEVEIGKKYPNIEEFDQEKMDAMGNIALERLRQNKNCEFSYIMVKLNTGN